VKAAGDLRDADALLDVLDDRADHWRYV